MEGALISKNTKWPWRSRSIPCIFYRGLPQPYYIFCVNLVNMHWFFQKLLSRQSVTDRRTGLWIHIVILCERLEEVADDRMYWIGMGNFCVNPRFYPTNIGWNLGKRQKVSTCIKYDKFLHILILIMQALLFGAVSILRRKKYPLATFC